MRFEIKSGGVAAILVGIAALSGAVFLLGLLAGYDVGRESQTSAAQIATDYPVTAPLVSAAAAGGAAGSLAPTSPIAMPARSPAAPYSPAAPATRVAPLASAKPAAAKPPTPSRARPPSAVSPATERLASAPPPRGVSHPETGADTADAAGGAPSSPAAAHLRHKPFNIQIQAVMDRSGANEIVHRLQALGYQPHLAPVPLNGQTWYKVVIGPYPTQEAAAVAQQEMRTKYNNLYGGAAHARSSASDPGANPSD